MNGTAEKASTSPTATRTFEVHIKGMYLSWEIPPRCRNPRDVPRDTETTVQVPIATADEAPVVIRRLDATNLDAPAEDGGGEYGAMRGWNGRLFRRRRLNYGDHTPFRVGGEGAADFPAELDYRAAGSGRAHGTSSAEFASFCAGLFADTLLVENTLSSGETILEVWEETDEPRYVVGTMGLGGNHGCTYLDPAEYDNSNIAASSYFRADDFSGAQAYALQVAEGRGDTESIPRIERQTPVFEILDPSYVTLVVPTEDTDEIIEARTQLRRAAEAYERCVGFSGYKYTAAEEAKAWKALSAARKALLALTDDVTSAETSRRPYEARNAR